MSLQDDDDAGVDDDAEDALFDADDGDNEHRDDGADEDDEPSEAEQAAQAAVDKLAAKVGWKPQKDWKGAGWMPADKFLETRAKSASNAKRETRDALDRLDRLEASEVKSRERAFAQLDAQAKRLKAEAIKKGGDDAVDLVEDIDKAVAEEKAKIAGAPNAETELTPLDEAFFSDHGWLVEDEDDEEAEKAFNFVAKLVAGMAKKNVDPVSAYEAAENALRKAYPHRYEDEEDERPRRGQKPGRRAPELSGGRSRASDAGGGRSDDLVAKLPPEALRAADEYVKRGTYGSRREYAEVYFSELKKERRG